MKILSLLLLIFSFNAWSEITIKPKDKSRTVHPGDLVEAILSSTDTSIKPEVLREAVATINNPKKVLFVSIRKLNNSETEDVLIAKVVFGPEFNPDEKIRSSINGEVLEFAFGGWLWNPQMNEVPKEFDYEQIPLLSRAWWIKNWHWLAAILFLVMIVGVPTFVSIAKKRNQRKKILEQKKKWLQSFAEAKSRENLSDIWRCRDEIKAIFPECLDEQREFFDKLNQHQFKPIMADSELIELIKAKDEFLAKVAGRQRGV